MLKKLLITTAVSGLMFSSALAQSPSQTPSSPAAPSASPSDTMKSDTMKSDIKADTMKSDTSKATVTTGASSASASAIAAQKPDQMLVSSLKGVDVLGSDDKKIGDISDILVSKDGKVEAFLVSVGGFLGVGAKEVALAPSSLQLTEENNSWKAKVSMTKDQLAQAPNFERVGHRTTTGAASSTSSSTMGSSRNTPAGAPASTAPAK